MRAEELIKRYTTERHVENGVFVERHYISEKEGRADSGSIFYYVAPGERTEFHRIDCDEYWCHNAGEDIEIWSFSKGGELKKLLLGTSEDASPFVFFKSGEIFASRMKKESRDGAFVTCITVPRFTYDGFEMFGKEKMISLFPESKGFWEEF